MRETEQRLAAKQFVSDWLGRGDEKQETQSFWLALLQKVFGVSEPEKEISFEVKVKLDHTSFIDAYLHTTRVLIEQKGQDVDLTKGYKQSDGSVLTPFGQARRYAGSLPHNQNPRWIVVCNFREFHIHDMNRPNESPEVVKLENLEKEYHRLNFLVDTGDENIKEEMRISLEAGALVRKIYDALLAQYQDPESAETLQHLNILCVRLVFCLYAEDAGVFGSHGMFFHYLNNHRASARDALIALFRILNTPEDVRDPYLDPDLLAFPYVSGGLFADEHVVIPRLTEEIVDTILSRASAGFDWSDISPTIFGAVFESTLNPETRRSGGMHYTSVENIHKVIDPLFLDSLYEEFEEIKAVSVEKTRVLKLEAFQQKLASLTFLDPACGSGNFLTETFLSLRRLENKTIELLIAAEKKVVEGQIILGDEGVLSPIKVSISQFYGIEINDFAVTVAKAALWIAESQMMQETENIVHQHIEFLPLKTKAHIVAANALRIDWESVVPKDKLNYIISNPPFIGARMMDQGSEQKQDIQDVFGNIKDVQDLDYVTCWYKLAAKMMLNTKIETALVSTNSICQGSQVPILWNVLLNEYGVKINFAHQTFKWNSESSDKAAVHCVVVGFSLFSRAKKSLFTEGTSKPVTNISPYLIDGSDSFVTAQKDALCNVPKMNFGNQPRDGGFFIITEEERINLLKKEPSLEKWLHSYMGADEFIKGKKRWCLWLKKATPSDIKASKTLYELTEAVRSFRLASKAKTTNGYAKVPHLFAQITQPDDAYYLLVPSVSSERRRYVPIGFMTPDIISSNAVQILPNATLYHFGILTSNIHMAWMRTVCGRLEMRYRYSKELVYNTFPWPEVDEAQKAKIEQTAQGILDARALYPDCSLADLYDEVTMPPELRKAHQANDRAVMEAYGFDIKTTSEESCVAELMKLYQKLTEQQ